MQIPPLNTGEAASPPTSSPFRRLEWRDDEAQSTSTRTRSQRDRVCISMNYLAIVSFVSVFLIKREIS